MTDKTEIKIPDIGDFAEVEVIEVLVSEGDIVNAEDSLLSLESDKATMEIPSPIAGKVLSVSVSVGDMVAEGSVVAIVETTSTEQSDEETAAIEEKPEAKAQPEPEPEKPADQAENPEPSHTKNQDNSNSKHSPPSSLPEKIHPAGDLPHASPAIRRFARELGADLTKISGTGAKGRIKKEDVQQWIKNALSAPAESIGSGIPSIPEVDFSRFGEVESVPLSRIKKLSGPHLQRAWLNIPHVTQHEEADITDLETFRKSLKEEAAKEEIKVTLLAFALKILVGALKKFPEFNASLAADGESLILKKYFNIGIAVDTPQGLVVPVIKDVDQKSIFELAKEMGELSGRARDGKLSPADLQGGCMSISSLGGLGGTGFTPIVNAPEVAILGIARAKMQPVWNGTDFEPRLILPLSLSYDHRAIDGADGARFCAYLAKAFADMRRLVL